VKPNDRYIILKGAQKLSATAEALKQAHTVPPEHEHWLPEDMDAKWEYEDLVEIAGQLRRIAE
jgi:hypothetical protein